MSSEKPSAARDRILEVAGPLFWREGYRAVGVDRVIAEAGVAKATFYRHFPSKDELIVAWIDQAETFSREASPPHDGPAPLFAYTDRMIDVAGQPTCLGCTFQGTAAEFADPAHPGHAAAQRVKRRVIADLIRRAEAQGIAEAEKVAEQVFLFMEGVWAATRMFGQDAPLTHAKAAIRQLVAPHATVSRGGVDGKG